MSRLAHAVFGAPRFATEKRDLDRKIQLEVGEAKRIQTEKRCTWSEALRLARAQPERS